MRILIIHNPIAGNGKRTNVLEPFERKGFTIIETKGPNDATQIVHENIAGYDLFVAAGGDGTVNEIAKALIGTEKSMGIIPMGSGNGLVNEVGQITVKALLENNYRTTIIDSLFLNEIPFFNVAGIGFEAIVAHEFAKKKKRGLIRYIIITISKIFSYRPDIVSYSYKEIRKSAKVFSITIANSRQYGNNAIISPSSKPDDGIFEVCMIRSFPLLYGPILSYRLFSRTISKFKYYEVIMTTSFHLMNEISTLWNLDGESIRLPGPFHISIKPASLKIISEIPN